MTELLTKRGVNVHICSPKHPNALELAVTKGNAQQMKVLLEHGNDINAQMSSMLRFFRACVVKNNSLHCNSREELISFPALDIHSTPRPPIDSRS
jgi:hypothetical protein